jgi:galactokinase
MRNKFRAPGRVCLFGEHQDYLGLPVIAAAIDKYIFIDSEPISEKKYIIKRPNLIEAPFEFQLNSQDLNYGKDRALNYLSACYNLIKRKGGKLDQGRIWELTGSIPINAGASSSSAMVICALLAFAHEGGIINAIDPQELAILGYKAEVAEFGEAGGMMDHFASAFGGLIAMETNPPKLVIHVPPENVSINIVLADSGVKKRTVEDLKRVKASALESIKQISTKIPDFNIYTTPTQLIFEHLDTLPENLGKTLKGNIINRDITQKVLKMLKNGESITAHNIGPLILEHHKALSELVGVSIPKIDEMVEIAIDAGALGAKINGSGFGGTMFAICDKNAEFVKNELENHGFDSWVVKVSPGAQKF